MNRRIEIIDTHISDLKVLERKPISDHRGFLERLFCTEELRPILLGKGVAQVNRTKTRQRGTVRGMHFQRPPSAEIKLVSCLRGEIFDVAVDLRAGSPTFLKWHAEILSEANHRTLAIPEGFAHGFQALHADCEMLYFHTRSYDANAEGGLNALDPLLKIKWPLSIGEQSVRDLAFPFIDTRYSGFDV